MNKNNFIVICLVIFLIFVGCFTVIGIINYQGELSTIDTTVNELKSDFNAEILSCILTKDWDNNPSLGVKIKWTNNSTDTCSYWLNLMNKAFQNGVELEVTWPDVNNEYYEYYENSDLDLRPGTSLEVMVFFKLRDTKNPVEIEISETFSLDNIIITTGTYNFE